MSDDERLVEVCQAACNGINAILAQAEHAHPHAPWSILVNWIADAMIASPVGGEQYRQYLNDAVEEVYGRKVAAHLLESVNATHH